jgi:CheY-like chemotaxis protein
MMLRLLNEALDLARIEAGRLELLPQDVDLVALLAELIELEQPLADSKGLRLQLAVAPQAELRVQADPLRLQQILLNLLGNAIKFTEQGGVSLSLERVAAPAGEESDPGCARLRFCVEDSGRGLDADALQRLFQPFVQAEGARTAQQHGGSGLGLLISRQLAEAMGGSLRADSRPGQGSRFVLELDLPILGRAEDAPAAAPGPGLAPARGGGSARRSVSVLLVEDHPDVAEALAGLLRRWGCEVQVAPHGLQALALVEQQPFELGLFDLDLPGLDGFELARLLRDRLPRLIALSARSDVLSESLAREAGFGAFLRKPVEPERLREVLIDREGIGFS